MAAGLRPDPLERGGGSQRAPGFLAALRRGGRAEGKDAKRRGVERKGDRKREAEGKRRKEGKGRGKE